MKKEEFIASVRHIGWITYQIAAGQEYNEEINEDQFESLLDGVKAMLQHPDISPEGNHNNWMKAKTSQGWVYGKVKDFKKKTHPDLVSFSELPRIEQGKDLADSVSHRLAVRLWGTIINDQQRENLAAREAIKD